MIKEYKPYKIYKHNKFQPNKYYDNSKKKSTKKPTYSSNRKSSYSKNDITCHKCGKKGHYKMNVGQKSKLINYK